MKDEKFLNDLVQKIQQGHQFKYLYFWGHIPKKANLIDKSCFSQWFPAQFNVEGIEYFTAEHYMMAQKAKLFNDKEIFAQILQVKHPNEAKQLGRKVRNYDEQIWREKRFDIVVQANFAKFSQHPELKKFLLATKDRILVEASPVDKIWGVGMAQDHPHIQDPSLWQGLNLLGFALIHVRELLLTE
ncbi:NADAR family protein [Acinetobacter baumannii]|uniref:NADAR family protein n=1 Tax=Acinetobacter baumannii TaxID=470 RepID=UPI00186B76F6|nr:NADAR family protein [Acinetobacter baumannii]MBE4722260.1 NADAR family protein [Acinetobacter baumannii]MCT9460294.1 NADAR family protein [Acinetobacter baumannii]MDC4485368.1 NADAR family protein [Acinetobacter baumannii]MDC4672150.1 NADAR family protein [Acinetobacter baumannii]MDC4705969.1 NADAR family protein [Acinetobacter baumannii]